MALPEKSHWRQYKISHDQFTVSIKLRADSDKGSTEAVVIGDRLVEEVRHIVGNLPGLRFGDGSEGFLTAEGYGMVDEVWESDQTNLETLNQGIKNLEDAGGDVKVFNQQTREFLERSLEEYLNQAHINEINFDLFMYDIEGLAIILSNKDIPGLVMPLLQIKNVDDSQWHPFSLEDCNLLRSSWVGRNLSDHIRSIKYAMAHLDSNMSRVQLKLNPEGNLFLRLSFNYSYGDVWHVLLPLNYQDSDEGRTQFLLEMYLRFGTEFMIRAFSNYGSIQGVFEPDLFISEVSGGGRPFISLSLIMLVKVGGQTVTVQTRLKNPEELYFLDWKEPDVKVVNWKDFFDQFKKKVEKEWSRIGWVGYGSHSLLKINFRFTPFVYDEVEDSVQKYAFKKGFRAFFLQSRESDLQEKG